MAIQILMIDDHPTQIEGYKMILSYNNWGLDIETTSCFNCETAYNTISNTKTPIPFDVVFLDRSLPPYPQKNIESGEDLALLVREYIPGAKIIMLTSHTEEHVIYNIFRKINPEGFLVKSDFTAEELLDMFEQVMNGNSYKSETVTKSIDKFFSKTGYAQKGYLDSINKQIILLLSQGVKTKTIPEHLGMTVSAVDKRKRVIKKYFGIEQKGGDEAILREARKIGFV